MNFSWLLEFKSAMGASLYLTSPEAASFDANSALHFESKEDAERFKSMYPNNNLGSFVPMEHGFYDHQSKQSGVEVTKIISSDGRELIKLESTDGNAFGKMKFYLSIDDANYVRDALSGLLASNRSPL